MVRVAWEQSRSEVRTGSARTHPYTSSRRHALMKLINGREAGAQTVMVSELFKHAQQARSERQLPGFRFLQWYFFLIVTFFTHMRCVQPPYDRALSSPPTLSLGPTSRRLPPIIISHHNPPCLSA